MLEPFCLSLLLRWIRSPTAMPLLHDMRSLTLVLVISRALTRRSMIAVSLLTSSLPFRVWMRVSMLCVLTTSSLSCVIGLASMSILCVKTSCTSSSCSASVRPSLEGILMYWIALVAPPVSMSPLFRYIYADDFTAFSTHRMLAMPPTPHVSLHFI